MEIYDLMNELSMNFNLQVKYFLNTLLGNPQISMTAYIFYAIVQHVY